MSVLTNSLAIACVRYFAYAATAPDPCNDPITGRVWIHIDAFLDQIRVNEQPIAYTSPRRESGDVKAVR